MKGQSKNIDFNTKVGARLRKLRENKGFYRKELCKYLSFHENSISNHESGNYSHSLFLIMKYCKFYGISLDKFAEGIDIEQRANIENKGIEI